MNRIVLKQLVLGIITLFIFPSILMAQTVSLKGKVTDGTNPLGGVTVSVEGTTKSTATNDFGEFQIESENGQTLVFRQIGYLEKSILVKKETYFSVQLNLQTANVEEIVVVGYGTQSKMSVTGSISTVQAKEISKTATASFATALAGRITGLSANQTGGGMPGMDDPAIYLRGAATLNNANPLIIIDGIPRDNIRTLDVNEVESVSVLKDASATAVYGVRGANGVIIITTKRGEIGKANLGITALQTFTSFTREPERLSSLDYIDMRNQAFLNDGYTDLPFSEEVRKKYENPLYGLDLNDPDYENKAKMRTHIYPSNYFYGETFRDFAPEMHLNANIRGGTNRTLYFFNVGYLKQGGHLNIDKSRDNLNFDPSISLNRLSLRSNLDYKMSDFLTARLNIASYIEDHNTPNSKPFSSVEEMFRGLMLTTMQINPITIGPKTLFNVDPDVAGDHVIIPAYSDWSPYGMINRNGYEVYTRTNLNSSLEFDFDFSKIITPGLTFKVLGAYDAFPQTRLSAGRNERTYYASANYTLDEVMYSEKGLTDIPMSLSRSTFNNYNINVQAAVNYQRSFGKHHVTGLLLGQRDYWEAVLADLPFNVVGFAGRATYNYDQRYFAELNMGYNGSEQFSPEKRFGLFPAYSAAWVVSNEKFFQENSIVQYLKIRGSLGRVGNDRMGQSRFLYMDNITIGHNSNVKGLGVGEVINQGLLGNPDLTWEIADKKNAGLDFKLFKVLNGSVDYFTEKRSQILISRDAVPIYQGVPLGNIPRVNMGKVDNKGVEVELGYNQLIGNEFQVFVKGNVGFNKNKVVYNDEPGRDETFAYRYTGTGYRMGQQWGYKIDWNSPGKGFWTSEKEIADSELTYSFGDPQAGDLKYLDLNKDGTIDPRDIAPIGNTTIPGITFGFDIGFTYKGFDFSALFSGVSKFSSVWSDDGIYENIKQGTYFGYHKNAWTEERFKNGKPISYPRLSTGTTSNHVSNEFFLQDRSFIRLRNVQLGYTLPKQVLDRLKIKGVRVFVSGQNLFLWDKLNLEHQDPEKTHPVRYPITKLVGFGANVSF